MTSRSELVPEEKLTPEETLTLWVYERQEPLADVDGELEPRYGRLQAILKGSLFARSARSHLRTAHRKLGAITFVASRPMLLAKRDPVRVQVAITSR